MMQMTLLSNEDVNFVLAKRVTVRWHHAITAGAYAVADLLRRAAI